MAPRHEHRDQAILVVLVLVLALTGASLQAVGSEAPATLVAPDDARPVLSSSRTPEALVAEARGSWQVRASHVGAAHSAGSQGATAAYDWGLEQSWLPGLNGLQWCVAGFQTTRPRGGVKVYQLPRVYRGPESLLPRWLVVTLAAQEQIPAPRAAGRSADPAMPHEFAYGTCVAPELTRVGRYNPAVYFCGSDQECASHPHVFATTIDVRPLIWSFDTCVDRQAEEVEIFQSALYFDQRPTTSSLRPVLDGEAQPGASIDARWPWVFVKLRMPLAAYDQRFGAEGSSTLSELESDSAYTPRGDLFFTRSSWLRPCMN
jgi:hypothetical protein